ncbi:hypothetical protein E2C01_101806 [Portunus trituberculatus]|uniref:Uncharacterized protein n=1 Tax=Portunus trituberculatus TaxID=210409 RepID=A0A5B7KGY4_PORTR|nr:hypothetical protein [Portunus trituberculatus]
MSKISTITPFSSSSSLTASCSISSQPPHFFLLHHNGFIFLHLESGRMKDGPRETLFDSANCHMRKAET